MNVENAHPQDYLNFYCLGKREELLKDDLPSDDQPSEKNAAVLDISNLILCQKRADLHIVECN